MQESSFSNLGYGRQDFSSCENEPIQYCGAIQSFGWLLVFDTESEEIFAASENCEQLFLQPIESMLGRKIGEVLQFIDQSSFALAEAFDHKNSRFRNLVTKTSNQMVTVNLSVVDRFSIIDLERPGDEEKEPADANGYIRQLVHRMDAEGEIQLGLKHAVDQIKNLTLFDRVMIYRFESNSDGFVAAESVGDEFEKFIGLHYPASDIPPQARKLYLNSAYRSVADVDSEPIAIRTSAGRVSTDIDLGSSNLRAVSPFHIQYLKNMGVRSSFSVPLKVNGKLWGLVACHHYRATKHLSRNIRSSCELAAKILAARIADHINERRSRVKNVVHTLSQSILDSVAKGCTAGSAFRNHDRDILELADATGAYVRVGAEEIWIGVTPPPDFLQQVVGKLQMLDSLGLINSRSIAEDFSLPLDPAAVGILAVPLSFAFEDLIVWFRPEYLQEVHWGGDPHRKFNQGDSLEPRASFNAWVEQVTGKSREWDEATQEAAQYILFTFVKGIFKKSAELSIANKKLAEATQAKDDFIGLISHELRTPLGIVINWAKILRDKFCANTELTHGLDVIHRNAKVQSNLINDLLDIVRISAGKLRIDRQDGVDMESLINEVIFDLRPSALAKAIDVQSQLEKVTMTLDADRIRQVLLNLLANAIKFTPHGGVVGIVVRRHDEQCEIIVTDNGVGISADELSNIFGQFTQLHNGSGQLHGLGLGLFIVKIFVELHGGEIVARSAGKDLGSTFTVSIPMSRLLNQFS